MDIRIALAGNPNSGKTTLFNALTGSNQFVGNWPGVKMCIRDRTGRRGACQLGDGAVLFRCGGGGLFHTAAAYGAGAYSELKLQPGR